jgi:acetyl-CoA C-acetyltransferase
MGDAVLVDYMLGILHDPFHRIHMGITAENVAASYGISRASMQDELAVKATSARPRHCRGALQGADRPVEMKTRKGTVLFDTDEHVRADTSWTRWPR